MQSGTRIYLSGFSAVIYEKRDCKNNIKIIEKTTIQTAAQYANSTTRMAVLNFANAYSPGGGVENGDMAQEESLCRSSNLYYGLTIPYVVKHYYKKNVKMIGDMGTDDVIYFPGVTVIKTDDDIPILRDIFYKVDVITCAAPYYNSEKRKPVTFSKLEDVFYHRIKNILEVAVANDVDILILGAFGCGAFNNPPNLVASVFFNLLIQEEYRLYFNQVIFAIKANDKNNSDLEAFRHVFRQYEVTSSL